MKLEIKKYLIYLTIIFLGTFLFTYSAKAAITFTDIAEFSPANLLTAIDRYFNGEVKTLHEIHKTGEVTAIAHWLLTDSTISNSYFSQKDYEAGVRPSPPSPGARLLFASGGRPLFDTPMGIPNQGDYYIDNGKLVVYINTGEDFVYHAFKMESERQVDGKWIMTGPELNVYSSGHRIVFKSGEWINNAGKITMTRQISGVEIFNNVLTVNRGPTKTISEQIIEKETHHSVAYNTDTSSIGFNVSSLTYAHTTTGANKALFVGVLETGQELTSSVTYNGSSTNWVEMWDVNAQVFLHNSGHYVVNPAATGNVVATVAAAVEELASGALSMTGVNQTTPVGTAVTANGASGTRTVNISSETDALVVDALASQSDTITPGAGQTVGDWILTTGEQDYGGSAEAGAATVTMSWSVTGVDGAWLIGGVSFKPATSVVAPTVTSAAATAVVVSSAVLNGEITVTGGANATVRGFAWGTNSLLNSASATTTDSGDYGTGTFSQPVSGLLAGVVYYFRAYATNSAGTGYGTILNFTAGTDTAPSRKMRLFEGFTIKFISGRIILHQK